MEEKDEKKGRSLTLRLPAELHETLKREAKHDGRAIASAVRVAIEQWIDRQVALRKGEKS